MSVSKCHDLIKINTSAGLSISFTLGGVSTFKSLTSQKTQCFLCKIHLCPFSVIFSGKHHLHFNLQFSLLHIPSNVRGFKFGTFLVSVWHGANFIGKQWQTLNVPRSIQLKAAIRFDVPRKAYILQCIPLDFSF